MEYENRIKKRDECENIIENIESNLDNDTKELKNDYEMEKNIVTKEKEQREGRVNHIKKEFLEREQ
jgi:frataxin-like iron-binding protein CyaY